MNSAGLFVLFKNLKVDAVVFWFMSLNYYTMLDIKHKLEVKKSFQSLQRIENSIKLTSNWKIQAILAIMD